MSEKIFNYLKTCTDNDGPIVVCDTDLVVDNFTQMRQLLPICADTIYYAMKANPDPLILKKLADVGCCFDCASKGEIELLIESTGVSYDRISFGNTIKKERDITWAYEKGVRCFAFDSEPELRKLAQQAPGSKVFCRILSECDGAEWPLSKKFGCVPAMAMRLLKMANTIGLDAYGISFHVGSQQTDLTQWSKVLRDVADMFRTLSSQGVDLRMVNIGGGFPARYRAQVGKLEAYCEAVNNAINQHFVDAGLGLPIVYIEPGRSLVGDAGVLQSEVVLISKKADTETKRWVYLDIGIFGGLAEALGESIKYRFKIISADPDEGNYEDDETGDVIIAGPSCDSTDVLYEHSDYKFPMSLKAGDHVQILSTGAYTTTYSSVGFNGFAPLKSICI